MRKRIVALLTAGLLLGGPGTLIAVAPVANAAGGSCTIDCSDDTGGTASGNGGTSTSGGSSGNVKCVNGVLYQEEAGDWVRWYNADYPGCNGHISVYYNGYSRQPSGEMVFRFYGTLANPVQAMTVSRANLPSYGINNAPYRFWRANPVDYTTTGTTVKPWVQGVSVTDAANNPGNAGTPTWMSQWTTVEYPNSTQWYKAYGTYTGWTMKYGETTTLQDKTSYTLRSTGALAAGTSNCSTMQTTGVIQATMTSTNPAYTAKLKKDLGDQVWKVINAIQTQDFTDLGYTKTVKSDVVMFPATARNVFGYAPGANQTHPVYNTLRCSGSVKYPVDAANFINSNKTSPVSGGPPPSVTWPMTYRVWVKNSADQWVLKPMAANPTGTDTSNSLKNVRVTGVCYTGVEVGARIFGKSVTVGKKTTTQTFYGYKSLQAGGGERLVPYTSALNGIQTSYDNKVPGTSLNVERAWRKAMYTWYYNHVTSSNYYVGSDLKKGIQDTPAPRYVVGKAGLSWNDNMIKDLRAAATDGAEQISGWAPSSAPLAAGTLLSYGSRCRIAAPMNVLQTKSTNPNVIINYPISIDHTPVYQVRTDGADQTFSVNVGEPTCDANGGPATDCDAVVYQPVTYDLNVDVTGAGTWKMCQVYDATCDGVYETQASGSDTTVFFHFYRATPPGANIRVQVANLRTSYQPPDGETRIVLNIEDPVTGAPLKPINVSTASTGPSIIVCQVASQPGCAPGGSNLVKTDGFTVTDPGALGSQQTYTYQAPVISAVSVPQ